MKIHVKILQLALSASLALTIAACSNRETEMKEKMQSNGNNEAEMREKMQSKLENCFTKAEANSFQDIAEQWKAAKCDAFDALTRDERSHCGYLIKLRKEGQEEDELRCMKLYKN